MGPNEDATNALSAEQIASFRENGFCRVPGAFDPDVAEDCAIELKRLANDFYELDMLRPETFGYLGDYFGLPYQRGGPFKKLNTKAVLGAFDQLVGVGRYVEPTRHGYFWASLVPDDAPPWQAPISYGRWHIDHGIRPVDSFSLTGGTCALVPIWLFTHTPPKSGATVALRGSHQAVAKCLARSGTVSASDFDAWCEAYALNHPDDLVEMTGEAGDLFLAHPFTIHTGAPNSNAGAPIRLMCNSGLGLVEERRLEGELSPIEEVIVDAISGIQSSQKVKSLFSLMSSVNEWRGFAGKFSRSRVRAPELSFPRNLVFSGLNRVLKQVGGIIEKH